MDSSIMLGKTACFAQNHKQISASYCYWFKRPIQNSLNSSRSYPLFKQKPVEGISTYPFLVGDHTRKHTQSALREFRITRTKMSLIEMIILVYKGLKGHKTQFAILDKRCFFILLDVYSGWIA